MCALPLSHYWGSRLRLGLVSRQAGNRVGVALIERLVLEQAACESIEILAVALQQRGDLLMRRLDDPPDLLVDQTLGRL